MAEPRTKRAGSQDGSQRSILCDANRKTPATTSENQKVTRQKDSKCGMDQPFTRIASKLSKLRDNEPFVKWSRQSYRSRNDSASCLLCAERCGTRQPRRSAASQIWLIKEQGQRLGQASESRSSQGEENPACGYDTLYRHRISPDSSQTIVTLLSSVVNSV